MSFNGLDLAKARDLKMISSIEYIILCVPSILDGLANHETLIISMLKYFKCVSMSFRRVLMIVLYILWRFSGCYTLSPMSIAATALRSLHSPLWLFASHPSRWHSYESSQRLFIVPFRAVAARDFLYLLSRSTRPTRSRGTAKICQQASQYCRLDKQPIYSQRLQGPLLSWSNYQSSMPTASRDFQEGSIKTRDQFLFLPANFPRLSFISRLPCFRSCLR
jgi:hypothetical protein